MIRRLPFRLDRHDRKLLGVCAGIGRSTRIDPTLIRIGFAAVPLLTFVTVWQALLAYLLIAIVGGVAAGRRGRASDFERMGETPRASLHDVRTRLDVTDRRLMAIDHHLNSSESDALAREIEALRKEEA